MNKKIMAMSLLLILFLTGCSCEYNLTIIDNSYKEQIKIMAETQEEKQKFNNNWEIPADKSELENERDLSSTQNYNSSLYDYHINSNVLTFSYDFLKEDYLNSSAVSKCYNTFTFLDYEDRTIISTSSKLNCFDTYPGLNSIVINIKTDREVISNNADSVNKNIYSWYINKESANDKPINLVLSYDNSINNSNSVEPSSSSINTKSNSKKSNSSQTYASTDSDYTIYIFLGILLIIMLFVYFTFNNIKNKNNKMDD